MNRYLQWIILLPIFNFLAALSLFLSLLLLWVTSGAPKYKASESNVVYISDVGAVYKNLFIGLGTVIGVLYVVTLLVDYSLRRKKKIQPMRNRKSEKPLAITSIVFGVIACAGLILLTIFDAFNHSTLHWTFALIFFVGLAVSGALNVAEIGLLHKDHPKSPLLKWSYRIKVLIIVLAVICLICMIVLMAVCSRSANKYDAQGNLSSTCNKEDTASALFEWCIAFLFSFYLATTTLDLWPYRENRASIIGEDLSTTMSQTTTNV
ncbi:Frag1/DRAM/Sfk1 [Umbelopsis sp. PMI_123]|nr:Frag1/DRAM/Sfk1 [Umbelopsis sp. PMI_123]